MGIVTELICIVLVAFVFGLLAQSLRQPLVVGYILAGIAVGPHTGGFGVQNTATIEMLAEVGVALLLFTLGLEFSFKELGRFRRITLVGVPLQILLCIALCSFVALAGGFSFREAVWTGAIISLSSTMVVLKTLVSRDAVDTPAGRVMLAILVAQDLAVIPLTLLLPQVGAESVDLGVVGPAILKSVLFLSVMYLGGTKILPPLFGKIGEVGSRELFFLATLGVALGAGLLSYQMGLSLALGAFIAGTLLSQTDFNHQALHDVAALRDLFGLIFFVSVGMLFDPIFLLNHLGEVALLSLIVLVGKAIIIGGIVRSFGYDPFTAWPVGLGLAQVGELAFVLASGGIRSQQISPEVHSLIIGVVVVSMVLTPALFVMGRTVGWLMGKGSESSLGEREEERSDHVVIVGGGVVGQYVAKVLSLLKKPYLLIELDYGVVRELRQQGSPVLFGDASSRTILERAGVVRARLLVVTITDNRVLPLILEQVNTLNRNLPVVVQVPIVEDLNLVPLSTNRHIVQPDLEAGLEIIRQSLMALGSDDREIFLVLRQLRSSRYAVVSPERGASSPIDKQLHAAQLLDFMWFEVSHAPSLVGKTLRELALRDLFGVYVVAVIDDDTCTPNPGPEVVLSPVDLIGLIGTGNQLNSFRRGVESRTAFGGADYVSSELT